MGLTCRHESPPLAFHWTMPTMCVILRPTPAADGRQQRSNLHAIGRGWQAYFIDSNGFMPPIFNPRHRGDGDYTSDICSQFNHLL